MIVKRQPLKDGTTLMLGDKECRILQKIGQGSSCIVYKAKLNKRNVILKELYPKNRDIVRGLDNSLIIPRNSFEVFEEDKRRFSRSFDLQTKFHNYEELTNYTSDIEDIYNLNNTYYAVIDIVTGNSYDNIQPENLLSVLKVGNSLAKAISYYHQRGYLHLDIKPENIFNLPETDELVQLFDFDTVSTREEVLKGQFSYSEGYVAKEVKDAKESDGRFSEIDERADIFSIGVVIFEKIMGRRPDSSDHRKGKKWNFSLNPYLKDTVPQLQTGMTELFRKTISRDKNNRYSSAEELIKDLGKLIELTSIKVFLKSQNISPCTAKNIYIPRKSVCDSIYNRLNQYHILYIYTIRGNGKSETSREYAETYANNYNFIQSIFYSQNLKKTIVNLDFVGLKQEDKIAHTDEDIDRLYSYKLDLLGNTDIYTSNTLLIIDNYDYDSNPESEEYKQNVKVLADLRKLHIHIIFTTRINPTDKAHCFKLPDMFQEELEELFFKINPVQKDDPERKRLVDEIIEVSYNHTMTVKLVALQSKKYKKSLEEYLSVLKENGLNSHIQGRITNEKDDESVTMSAVYDHIKALFDFDNLSDKEKYIMVNACLLPLEGLDTVTFSNFIDLDNFDGSSSDCIDESIEDLANSGWINYADNDETKICLHPLIGDIVKNELKPELTEDKCRKFYISFLDLISDWGNLKIKNNTGYLEKENLIYSLFPKLNTLYKNENITKVFNYIYLHNDAQLYIKKYFLMRVNTILHFFGVEKKLVIPDYVTTIQHHAFEDCNLLMQITVSKNVKVIGYHAFRNCTSLDNFLVSDDNNYFCSCDGVLLSKDKCILISYPPGRKGTYIIPESVVVVEENAFRECKFLTDVTIPYTVQAIFNCAFLGCESLKKVVIPENIKVIEDGLFSRCINLSEVVISYGITTIGSGAFSDCSSLVDIEIPESVTIIGEDVFYRCVSLKNVVMPEHLKIWEHRIFDFTSNPKYKKSEFQRTFGNSFFESLVKNEENEKISEINISKDKNKINESEFYNYKSIKKVIIPDNITEIGNRAFASCCSLNEVIIPNSVTKIGDRAFSSCSSLKKIIIPNSVVLMGWSVFADCVALSEIILSDSITTIGTKLFDGCKSLKKIKLPNNVTSIGGEAFRDCISLNKIIIPNTVTDIGDGAFENCKSITQIYIYEGITMIWENTFKNCKALSQFTIPSTVTKIGYDAFNGCSSLLKIVIPINVSEIKWDAFKNCNSLIKITLLNAKLNISDSKIGYYEDKSGLYRKNNLTIEGYKGSTAEKYAMEHGFNFIALD